MENTETFSWFGVAVILIMGAWVLVPYLRGKSDLLTAWNILLLSIAMNTGVGCLEVRYGNWHWETLQWFQPTVKEVNWCMAANTVFIVALFLFYYYNPLPKYVASRTLNKWPPMTVATYAYVLLFCGLFIFLSFFTSHIAFVSQTLAQLSLKASVFALVFSFMLWWRNRVNVIWLMFFLAVLPAVGFYSIFVYVGRRLLLSIVLAPIMCVYSTTIRYWKPRYSMAALAGATLILFLVSVAYNSFRYFHHGHSGEERTAENVLAHVQNIGQTDWLGSFGAAKLHYFSQYSMHFSLLAERFVSDGSMPPKPLNTLVFLLSVPIPRELWEDKPQTVGITMVRDVVGDGSTNWGIGIAGHGIYEGGMPTLILYAFLTAFGIRFLDDPLKAQPANPFLIANFAAAAPHILMFARGDLGVVAFETIKCFIFMIMLAWGARLLFGTVRATGAGPTRPQPANYRPGVALGGRVPQ
jgi:hypothetical protein